MGNILDYLAWRGDVPFSVSPWNAVDGLLLAVLSYLNFHGVGDPRGWTLREAARIDLLMEGEGATFEGRKKVFEAMAASERFGESRMHHFIALTDEDISMQFSAMCIDLPDGTMAIAFRGTDNTLIGWREDFNMSFQTRVPGQQAAAYYLGKAAGLGGGPIRLTGHSKGGNLAVYAAAHAGKAAERIESIWSYDGPGMNMELSRGEGYGRIREKIHSYIPQTSIIGLLMEYYRPYTVVRSVGKGLEQHEPMTWQVFGTRFEEMEEIDRTAKVTCDTLHEMLANSTPEQRSTFVDTLFRLADNTNATRMSDILNEKFRSLWKMAGGRKEVDPEARRIFNRLTAQAVTLGFGNAVERARKKNEAEAPGGGEEWTTIETAPETAPSDKQEKQEKASAPETAAEKPKRTRIRKARAGREDAEERARKKNEAEAPGGGEEWTTTETAPKEKSETALDKQGGPVVKKGPAPDL